VTVVVPNSRPAKQVAHPLWPWQEHMPSPHYPRRFRHPPTANPCWRWNLVLLTTISVMRATRGKAVTLTSIRVSSMGAGGCWQGMNDGIKALMAVFSARGVSRSTCATLAQLTPHWRNSPTLADESDVGVASLTHPCLTGLTSSFVGRVVKIIFTLFIKLSRIYLCNTRRASASLRKVW
jgi:hypothetical protein